MSKIIMIRAAMGLIPADETQWRNLSEDKIPFGEFCQVTISKPRNIKTLRRFFRIVDVTFDMQDICDTREQWRQWLTSAAGWCDFVQHPSIPEQTIAIPRSIAFENLDETEFKRLTDDTLTWLFANLATDEATTNELMQLI